MAGQSGAHGAESRLIAPSSEATEDVALVDSASSILEQWRSASRSDEQPLLNHDLGRHVYQSRSAGSTRALSGVRLRHMVPDRAFIRRACQRLLLGSRVGHSRVTVACSRCFLFRDPGCGCLGQGLVLEVGLDVAVGQGQSSRAGVQGRSE